MSKINLLSSKIFNRIAAGEVVERPSSVVKELVENSIDAKSTLITIEIIDGGTSLIKVSDNGEGISKDDLVNALMPHATSKIAKISDLDNIGTLGFRGEALPSIASVSKIEINSKPAYQTEGALISAEGGIIGEIKDSVSINGTVITVKNLFFNTPVRIKFLKSTRSEENEITATVIRLILGNPDISFKYIVDGKEIISSFGDGLESAFINVYGIDVLKNCLYIENEKNGISIKGYIGKQSFSKSNRNHETVFLNGRYIVNQTVLASIMNAYSPYLMKRQYPFCVLNITMPLDAVDVNVHPNKIDVRFINNQIIYSTIYSSISKVLDGTGEALNIVQKDYKDEHIKQETFIKSNDFNNDYVRHNASEFFDKAFLDEPKTKSYNKFDENKIENDNSKVTDIFEENKKYLESLTKNKEEYAKEIETVTLDKELKYIGQALNTFLIFEDGVDMYFIDQHAAHERILFDKFNEDLRNNVLITQPLLVPFILSVDSFEYDSLLSKVRVFNEMGFDITEFGQNTFKISSIPAFLYNMDLSIFFKDILSDNDLLKQITVNDILKDKIAQKACKSAIKSGDTLTENDINILLKLLKGNLGLKCPHGRPIAIKITRTEIDKWFKRIV